jgi:very-short-patch-repair endonuclease
MPPTHKSHTDPTILRHARDNRHLQTPAEAKLWQLLRNHNLDGYKFRRQHPIGHYVVDFYCHETRLVVEIDGRTHDDRFEYDAARTAWLQAQGCRVIRFSNQQVMRDVVSVAEAILLACREEPSP